MCVLSIKVPIRKKSGNLSYAPRIYLSVSVSLFVCQLLRTGRMQQKVSF